MGQHLHTQSSTSQLYAANNIRIMKPMVIQEEEITIKTMLPVEILIMGKIPYSRILKRVRQKRKLVVIGLPVVITSLGMVSRRKVSFGSSGIEIETAAS